jgi:putative flavoprotein involved in K+ transport
MSPGQGASSLDVLVIGGGQAGLAMGYELAQRGKKFQILDAGSEIGDAWRSRWDSLVLLTPAQYDNLPGLSFPAERDTYPGRDRVAGYLKGYAVRTSRAARSQVTSRLGKRRVPREAGAETLEAEQVVVATGPFQVPLVPSVAGHSIRSASDP